MGREVEVCRASLGSNCNDLIWNLHRPGGWTEGKADGCPSLSGLACRLCGHCWPTLQVSPSGLRGAPKARARVADGQAAWTLARGRDCGGQGGVEEGGPGKASCSSIEWLLSHRGKVLGPSAQLCHSSWVCLPIPGTWGGGDIWECSLRVDRLGFEA